MKKVFLLFLIVGFYIQTNPPRLDFLKIIKFYNQLKFLFNFKKSPKKNVYSLVSNKSRQIRPVEIESAFYDNNYSDLDTMKLWQAVYGNNFDAVIKAIDNGADVNSQSPGEWTPLFAAIDKENTDMVKFLIEKGAYLHYEMPRFGHDALFIASQKNNINIIELLLEKGLDINKKNKLGETPLFWACNNSKEKLNIDVIKILIKKGADVNIKNNSGNSVLLRVCQRTYLGQLDTKEIELIKILLEAGTDISITDVDDSDGLNNTIFYYAKKNGAILEILEQHLAKKHHMVE